MKRALSVIKKLTGALEIIARQNTNPRSLERAATEMNLTAVLAQTVLDETSDDIAAVKSGLDEPACF